MNDEELRAYSVDVIATLMLAFFLVCRAPFFRSLPHIFGKNTFPVAFVPLYIGGGGGVGPSFI